VLRKQGCHTEALGQLPNPLSPVATHDFYDLHLRGMILLESEQWPEAREIFERGLATGVPVH